MTTALLIAIVVAMVGDAITTLYGMKLGMEEANPLFRGKSGKLVVWRLVLVKAAVLFLAIWFRQSTAALVVLLCVCSFPPVWNAVQIIRSR